MAKNTTQNIIGGGTGGIQLGGGAGTSQGVPSTTAVDGLIIPILDQAGDDPWGLSQLIPQVGPGHAPQSVGARVASIAKLTLAQQQQLGAILAQAGIIAPKANYTTVEVQDAMTTAFKLTAESGTGSLSRTLTERSQQGAGTQTTGSTTVEAATRVNETTYSPQDIQDTVNAAAQKLVGRNATPQEVQAVADLMNQSSASKAQAAAGSEANAEQQDINAKNAVSGANAGGSGSFASDLLGALGMPQTDQNIAAINAWQRAEGGTAANNPLNTTQGAPGATNYNKVGVKNYTSYQEGLQATVQTLQNGHYANILNALRGGNSAQAVAAAVGGSPWGTSGSLMNQILSEGGGTLSAGSSTGGRNPASGVISPVGQGLTQGRTDQGVDYSGKGGLFAVGSGTILSVTNPGWPGGSFVTLKLDNPVDPNHSVVYYAEDIVPNVRVGQRVQAGAQIGTATGGGSGIEIGWADPVHIGQALAATQGGYTEGKPTQAGQDFLSYIQGGANILGAAKSGNTTDIYQQPVITQVPSQESPADAAAYYYENQDSPDYQKNNLLNVFEMIESNLKSPVTNQKVQAAPVSMRPGA